MSGRSKCITHELHWHYKEIWPSKVHVERYPHTMYKCHYEDLPNENHLFSHWFIVQHINDDFDPN